MPIQTELSTRVRKPFPESCTHAELQIFGTWCSVNGQTPFKLLCPTAGGHIVELSVSVHIPVLRWHVHRGVPERGLPGSKVDWFWQKSLVERGRGNTRQGLICYESGGPSEGDSPWHLAISRDFVHYGPRGPEAAHETSGPWNRNPVWGTRRMFSEIDELFFFFQLSEKWVLKFALVSSQKTCDSWK